MKGNTLAFAALFSIYAASWLSCSQPPRQAPENKFAEEIARAEENLNANPEDFEANRELGILYFKSGQFEKAVAALEKTARLNHDDPRTTCYLGLSYELSRQRDLALATFLKYLQISPQSPYRRWLKGRHELLSRQKLKEEMLALLQKNLEENSEAALEQDLAVLPFTYHGQDQKYFILGRGLQQLIINDLSRAPGLKIVERRQVQALLEQIAAHETLLSKVENRTAFIGKTLGAKTVIRGGYNISGEQVILDVVYWEVGSDEIPNSITHADSLENIAGLQKKIVLEYLQKRGIKPDPAIMDSIRKTELRELPALVAYSAGLAKEDAGEYRDALLFYRKAAELAPGFRECRERIEQNEDLSLALRDPDRAITDKEIAESGVF